MDTRNITRNTVVLPIFGQDDIQGILDEKKEAIQKIKDAEVEDAKNKVLDAESDMQTISDFIIQNLYNDKSKIR